MENRLTVSLDTRHIKAEDPADNCIRYSFRVALPSGRGFGGFTDDTMFPTERRVNEIRARQMEDALAIALWPPR